MERKNEKSKKIINLNNSQIHLIKIKAIRLSFHNIVKVCLFVQ